MSLNLSALISSFESVLTMPTGNTTTYTPAYMAEQWGNAFSSYATGGGDALSNLVVSGKDLATFKSTLEAAFSDPNSSCIPAITAAINAYWTSGVLAVASLPPGGIAPISNVVSSTPGSVSFDTSLKTDIHDGAVAIAGGLDNKTKSVVTKFDYMHSGSPPYPDVYVSSLQ